MIKLPLKTWGNPTAKDNNGCWTVWTVERKWCGFWFLLRSPIYLTRAKNFSEVVRLFFVMEDCANIKWCLLIYGIELLICFRRKPGSCGFCGIPYIKFCDEALKGVQPLKCVSSKVVEEMKKRHRRIKKNDYRLPKKLSVWRNSTILPSYQGCQLKQLT